MLQFVVTDFHCTHKEFFTYRQFLLNLAKGRIATSEQEFSTRDELKTKALACIKHIAEEASPVSRDVVVEDA